MYYCFSSVYTFKSFSSKQDWPIFVHTIYTEVHCSYCYMYILFKGAFLWGDLDQDQ